MTAAAAMTTPLKKRCSDAARTEGLRPGDEVADVVTDVFYHRRVRLKCAMINGWHVLDHAIALRSSPHPVAAGG